MTEDDVSDWLKADWRDRAERSALPDRLRASEGSGPWLNPVQPERPAPALALPLRLLILLVAFIIATWVASLVVYAGRSLTEVQLGPDPAHICGRC